MKANEPLYKTPKVSGYGYITSIVFYRFFTFVFFMVIFVIINLILSKLYDRKIVDMIVNKVFIFFAIIYFIINALILKKAAQLRAQHYYSYWRAFIQVIIELKMSLSFLPVIGAYFSPNNEEVKQKEFVEEKKDFKELDNE